MQEKLKIYYWEGVDANGKRIKGEIRSNDINTLRSELHQQAITLITVRKKFQLFIFHKSLKTQYILDFTQQLSTLINANITLVTALKIIGDSNPQLKTLINTLKNKIESGSSLTVALNQYPQYFDALYRNLIDAGEQSGTLGIMLKQIATYQEKHLKLKNKINKALIYPIAVLITAILVMVLMLIFVVPQFQTMFASFGAQLPLYTQLVIKLSHIVKSSSGWLLSFLIIIFLILRWCKTHSKVCAQKIDALLIKIPCFGSLLIEGILARFARTLATTFKTGIALNDALKIIAGSCGNLVYTQAILQIREQVIAGSAIHKAIRETELFPSRVIQMIAIAEESGELAMMLEHIATFYEQQVDNAADNLSKLLEPALMIFLGLIIGGLIAAMYLPIFKLGSVV